MPMYDPETTLDVRAALSGNGSVPGGDPAAVGFPTFGTSVQQTPAYDTYRKGFERGRDARLRSGSLTPADDAFIGDMTAMDDTYHKLTTIDKMDDARATQLMQSTIRAFGTWDNGAENAKLLHEMATNRNRSYEEVAGTMRRNSDVFVSSFATAFADASKIPSDPSRPEGDRTGSVTAPAGAVSGLTAAAASREFARFEKSVAAYEKRFGFAMDREDEYALANGVAKSAAVLRRNGITNFSMDDVFDAEARRLKFLVGGDDEPTKPNIVSQFEDGVRANHMNLSYADPLSSSASPSVMGVESGKAEKSAVDPLVLSIQSSFDQSLADAINSGAGKPDYANDMGLRGKVADALRQYCPAFTRDDVPPGTVDQLASAIIASRARGEQTSITKIAMDMNVDPAKLAELSRKRDAEREANLRQKEVETARFDSDAAYKTLVARGFWTGNELPYFAKPGEVPTDFQKAFDATFSGETFWKEHAWIEDQVAGFLKTVADQNRTAWRDVEANKGKDSSSSTYDTDSEQLNRGVLLRNQAQVATMFQLVSMVTGAMKLKNADGSPVLTDDDAKGLFSKLYDGKGNVDLGVLQPVNWDNDYYSYGSSSMATAYPGNAFAAPGLVPTNPTTRLSTFGEPVVTFGRRKATGTSGLESVVTALRDKLAPFVAQPGSGGNQYARTLATYMNRLSDQFTAGRGLSDYLVARGSAGIGMLNNPALFSGDVNTVRALLGSDKKALALYDKYAVAKAAAEELTVDKKPFAAFWGMSARNFNEIQDAQLRDVTGLSFVVAPNTSGEQAAQDYDDLENHEEVMRGGTPAERHATFLRAQALSRGLASYTTHQVELLDQTRQSIAAVLSSKALGLTPQRQIDLANKLSLAAIEQFRETVGNGKVALDYGKVARSVSPMMSLEYVAPKMDQDGNPDFSQMSEDAFVNLQPAETRYWGLSPQMNQVYQAIVNQTLARMAQSLGLSLRKSITQAKLSVQTRAAAKNLTGGGAADVSEIGKGLSPAASVAPTNNAIIPSRPFSTM